MARRVVALDATVDHEAEDAKHEVRHSHHEVNAGVVGLRFTHLVVFLRTGGLLHGILSGRAGLHCSERSQQYDEGDQSKQPSVPAHHDLLFLGDCTPASRRCIESVQHPINDDASDRDIQPDR